MSVKMNVLASRSAWLKARKQYIGGSDVACILGLNPWKTNVQLWREKKGLVLPADLSDNEAVIYGTKAEEHIRALYQLEHPQYEVVYAENNSWHNSKYPFAAASLDGWLLDRENKRKGIWECKTATITSSQQANKWKDGLIPDNYYCQVLYYLGVTEWDFVELRARLRYEFPEKVFITERDYHIERSEVEDDISMIMEATAKFHKSLKENKEPSLILTI